MRAASKSKTDRSAMIRQTMRGVAPPFLMRSDDADMKRVCVFLGSKPGIGPDFVRALAFGPSLYKSSIVKAQTTR